ncbi:dihydrodipicolinate synthase family protein [Paraburkholderia metrosideri]|uniref:4-hydroxy-tetrahydrodipicolinate synthase n=1 Tax=Paraburkholderia metrosideri TaxID=580937 RepID=A0ABM8NNN1_9BURK|nr:dihydrodipicolinate synthase family protein [Paraburkholderia metrosideri]CAD6535267.1 4-hydroxy-tetrahydrodipicolinate synthase [Paraburkholderia metrosideri]
MTITNAHKPLVGVFPVLPTPFEENGNPDVASLRHLVRYLIKAGVDGITYPGVASEFGQLSVDERLMLTHIVLDEIDGRVPLVAGVSSTDAEVTIRLAQATSRGGAAALMIAVPPDRLTAQAQIEFFSRVAAAVPDTPVMLQNVPAPVGAGLDPEVLLEILNAVPAIRYIKEETLPSGQRLSILKGRAPNTLLGVFGGAGGRYITDELRRGACGTMPAIELAEIHVALFNAHSAGHSEQVRALFTRMLPILNVQAVFRWSLTKYILHRRGLIKCRLQRASGPLLDAADTSDVDDFLRDIDDLLIPQQVLSTIGGERHGTA